MRVVTQIVVIAVLAGAGGGGWYAWQNFGPGNAAAAREAQRRAPPPLPVEFLVAKPGLVTQRIESVGTARANESMVVTSKISANVGAVRFTEGERVKAGQVLVELEASERRADLDQSRAQRDEIRQRLERSRQLRGTGSVTEARLDELEAQYRAADARMRMAEARLDDLRMVAPFDGRVGLRQVSPGALIQPGQTITTLDDISRIKVDFAVPETVLEFAKPGLPVLARSAAFADRIFRGEVAVVDTRVDPVTRSVRVNAVFDNQDEMLKPGMFLVVELILAQRENALLIPEEALVPEGTKQYVFVVKEGRAERRDVQIGQRLAGEVEIVNGVAAGDQVIVRGVQRIRAGAAVAARPLGRPQS